MEQAVAAAPTRGWLSELLDLYVAPREAFQSIVRRPRFWIPMVGFVALGLIFTAVWMQKIDRVEFFRIQLEESGQMDRIPADQRETMLERQAAMFPVFAWLAPLLFGPLTAVVMAALYLVVFRFLFGGEVTFKQSLAIVAWVFFAVGLVTTPLSLATMAMKGDWNVDPRTVLQANASLFLEKGSAPKPLFSLAESLDLFSFWMLGLLSVGYGVASRRSMGWALTGVVALWAVYVLGKAGLASLF